MRDILFPFQETALAELHDKINKAHLMWSERDPQIISFSAPTGSGKTIIMTTLFEDILNKIAIAMAVQNSFYSPPTSKINMADFEFFVYC